MCRICLQSLFPILMFAHLEALQADNLGLITTSAGEKSTSVTR